MRYCAYFASKLAVAGGILYGLMLLLGNFLPEESRDPHGLTTGPYAERFEREFAGPLRQGSDKLLINVAFMIFFLVCAGVLYLIIWDQRYRCRVCLRRLRMPIETGSWGKMLQFGRPRIEYICPYGHGTLRTDELQISGLSNPEWTPHSGDMWDELAAASKEAGDQP
jgi:hypothetical protein